MINIYKYFTITNIYITFVVVSLCIISLSTLLFYVYYNSSKILKHINNNSSCNNCISNKKLCNNILRYMFMSSLIYFGLLIIFILLFIKTSNIYIYIFILISNTIIFFMTLWYISCLYYSFKNMSEKNCPCVSKYKNDINMLKKVSLPL